MLDLQITESALEDLEYLKKFEQALILDEIENQLPREPLNPTNRRKPLRPNDLSEWEMKVGKYRVFYDVDVANKQVKIKAVGWKEHNRLLICGKEFVL
jgi:mRNA-degrading endonuclease RelE of RelBE toxin-antitoxin system